MELAEVSEQSSTDMYECALRSLLFLCFFVYSVQGSLQGYQSTESLAGWYIEEKITIQRTSKFNSDYSYSIA